MFDILDIFPFTSESKHMGIVICDTQTGDITFLQKGAEVVMVKIVQRNDWLEEENANMAQEGLLTLVIGWETQHTMILQHFISNIVTPDKQLWSYDGMINGSHMSCLGLLAIHQPVQRWVGQCCILRHFK